MLNPPETTVNQVVVAVIATGRYGVEMIYGQFPTGVKFADAAVATASLKSRSNLSVLRM